MAIQVRRIAIVGGSCAIAVLVCISMAMGSSPSGDSRNLMEEGMEFPLWRLLPSPHYAVLGKGSGRETEWSAFAYRPRGVKHAGAQPCISVIGLSREGSFPSDTSCGPVVPNKDQATEPPRYALYGRSHADRRYTRVIGETVMAMALPRDIVKVSVRMEDTARQVPILRDVSTRRLSGAQSTKANLRPFRYVAFNVGADACLASVAGFDSAGTRRFDLDEQECPIG